MYSKVKNYCEAVSRLEESIQELLDYPKATALKDGVIQRFEFTFELAWKSMKEYLIDQGTNGELHHPRQILKEAYATFMIGNPDLWLSMLEARNRTSHIYDGRQADRIAEDIKENYLPVLQALKQFYMQQI